MFFVLSLAVTGLFLIFLEFFLTGGIMAIGGILLLLASLMVCYMTYPTGFFLWIYCFFLGAAVYSVVRIGMKQRKSPEK
jgi:hypothetical protein